MLVRIILVALLLASAVVSPKSYAISPAANIPDRGKSTAGGHRSEHALALQCQAHEVQGPGPAPTRVGPAGAGDEVDDQETGGGLRLQVNGIGASQVQGQDHDDRGAGVGACGGAYLDTRDERPRESHYCCECDRHAKPVFKTAELYDPTANTFSALTATMTTARFFHTATLLPNGRVLLTGGGSDLTGPALDTAELW